MDVKIFFIEISDLLVWLVMGGKLIGVGCFWLRSEWLFRSCEVMMVYWNCLRKCVVFLWLRFVVIVVWLCIRVCFVRWLGLGIYRVCMVYGVEGVGYGCCFEV